MPANDAATLTTLSERITQAEANVKSADATRRADLQDRVRKARDQAKQNADELRHSTDAQVREEASEHWRAVKNTWNDHVQHLHDKVSDKEAELDLHMAQANTGQAEDYAAVAVKFALAAVGEAEYAALDAKLARGDAGDLAGSPDPAHDTRSGARAS